MSQLDTLVVDATSLYWRTDDAIMTCAKASCQMSATVLASGQPGPPSKLADGVALNSIAVDDTDVYWTSSAPATGAGGVYRCAKTGCGGAPQQIATATGDGVPWALVTDSKNVYWSSYGGSVMACAKSGCLQAGEVLTLAKGVQPGVGIATDGAYVYWTRPISPASRLNMGDVQRCSVGGCPSGPTVIATNQGRPMGIVSDGATVYWALSQLVLAGPSEKSNGPGVQSSTALLSQSVGSPVALAVDSKNLYWADWGNKTVNMLVK
jgi:hypothetical protein